MATNSNHLPKILFFVYLIFWIAMAIKPLYRFDWFLENIVIFIFVPVAILSYFKFPLSNRSYILIFIFAMFHTAAAHYTYEDTPWGDLFSAVLGWERNHFDRVVHFLFGIFAVPVVAELFRAHLPPHRFFRSLFLFGIIFATGSLYEISEFIVGVTVKPGEGLGFLGFQGDIWDTQKDMSLQAIGAIAGICWAAFRRKNFTETK